MQPNGTFSRGQLRQDVYKAIIGQLVGLTLRSVFLGATALAIWLAASRAWPTLKDLAIPLGLAIAAGVALVGEAMYRRRSRFRCHYPSYDFRFEVIEKELRYWRDDGGRLQFSRRLKVKALKDGLDDYVDRYLWTGPGPATLKAVKNVDRVREIERAGIWKFVAIEFGRTLNRGAEIEFQLEQSIDDSSMASRPFFSTSVEEPTRKLILDLALPHSLGIETCVCEVLRGIESIYPFTSTDHDLDRGRYRWVVERPKLYHHYRIYWTWPAEQPGT